MVEVTYLHTSYVPYVHFLGTYLCKQLLTCNPPTINILRTYQSRFFSSHCFALTDYFFFLSFLKIGPSPASFLFFSSFSDCNFNNTNCAWDSNPRPQDGRHRQNHGAMAYCDPSLFLSFFLFLIPHYLPFCVVFSVTSRKSPNVYKSCPRMISLEK